MHGLCEFIDKELKKLERKVEENGDLTEREIEYGKNLAKFKMALLTNKAMEREDGYSEGWSYRSDPYHDDDRSYGRTVRRDSMGRYSRGEGYSYADAKDDMISDLHKLMRKAPTEETKREFKSFIDRLEHI